MLYVLLVLKPLRRSPLITYTLDLCIIGVSLNWNQQQTVQAMHRDKFWMCCLNIQTRHPPHVKEKCKLHLKRKKTASRALSQRS